MSLSKNKRLIASRNSKRPAGEIMSTYVETIRPAASLQEAAGRMRAFGVGFLPVTLNGELVGTVTDRDLCLAVAARGTAAAKDPVSEVMSTQTVFCFEEHPVSDAIRLMLQNQIRRILVLNPEGRLRGVLSLGDLARNGLEREAALLLAETSHPFSSFPPLPAHV
jgi:CBS domain-containing protein